MCEVGPNNRPRLVVGAGSFATAAAIASKSQSIRSPACGETGCLWLNAWEDQQQVSMRNGWRTFGFELTGGYGSFFEWMRAPSVAKRR